MHMGDQMRIQIIAPIEFLLAEWTPCQGYRRVKAWNPFSFEGAEMGVGGSVAGQVFGSFEAFGARVAGKWFGSRFGSEDEGADG